MAGISKESAEEFRKGKTTLAQALNVTPNQIGAILQTGYTFFSQGKLQDAKNIFDGLRILDPGNAYVHGVLGAIYQKEENYEAAIQSYSAAIGSFPGDIDSLSNRGEICLKLGRFSEAASDLKKAIDLDAEGNHPAANRARMLVTLAQEGLKHMKEKGTKGIQELRSQIEAQNR